MLFKSFGLAELLIILAVVVMLLGVGRISKVAGEMGKGIRAFREGLKSDKPKTEKSEQEKNG